MKCYRRRRTCSHTSPRRSPTMVTLHDTRFVECLWWNDDWTVKTRHLTVVGLHDTGPRSLKTQAKFECYNLVGRNEQHILHLSDHVPLSVLGVKLTVTVSSQRAEPYYCTCGVWVCLLLFITDVLSLLFTYRVLFQSGIMSFTRRQRVSSCCGQQDHSARTLPWPLSAQYRRLGTGCVCVYCLALSVRRA